MILAGTGARKPPRIVTVGQRASCRNTSRGKDCPPEGMPLRTLKLGGEAWTQTKFRRKWRVLTKITSQCPLLPFPTTTSSRNSICPGKNRLSRRMLRQRTEKSLDGPHFRMAPTTNCRPRRGRTQDRQNAAPTKGRPRQQGWSAVLEETTEMGAMLANLTRGGREKRRGGGGSRPALSKGA